MERRGLLSRLAFLPLLAGVSLVARADETKKPLKIMFKSAWGSDDPTKAAFAFLHGNALAEAGHVVQIFLLGEAVSLMRSSVAHAVVPVGWPPLAEALSKASSNKIQIYACGAVLGRGASLKRISPSGELSSAIRLSLFRSSSGRIGSSPNSFQSPTRVRSA
jgi:predicted peroxiredoxin